MDAFNRCGMVKKAIEKQALHLESIFLRDFSDNPQGYIDDRPFGGGPGMVIRPEPLSAAIQYARNKAPKPAKVIYLTPAGRPLDHHKVVNLAQSEQPLIFIAGRYEGIDQRVIESEVDEMISIGDYVLTGGELAAMVVIDAMVRWIPGILGHQDSAANDAFTEENGGLLDCPHYTRPNDFAGKKVPQVLLSGDHKEIEKWRKKQALGQTWLHRPDILKKKALNAYEKELLADYLKEHKGEYNVRSYSGN